MSETGAADKDALKHIALMGGLMGEVRITTSTLAKSLGVTQQAASKRIISLEDNGYVKRIRSGKAYHIVITEKGKKTLLNEYASYQQIFSPVSRVELEGVVVSGTGKGSHFISLPGYRKPLNEILGSDPYEGTLNILVSHDDADKLSIIRGAEGRLIEGFTRDKRSYGAAVCFPAEVRKKDGRSLECAVILPFKSQYWDTIELVSRHHLRRSLGLEDGARVQVSVELC